jgi:hypothetical protein
VPLYLRVSNRRLVAMDERGGTVECWVDNEFVRQSRAPSERFLSGRGHVAGRSVSDGTLPQHEIPPPERLRAYFEYLVVGYISAALELLCGKPVESERLKGGSGTEFCYRLRVPGRAPARP